MFFENSWLPHNYKDVMGLIGGHIEAVLAVGGTIVTGAKTLSEYSQSRSTLISKRNQHIQRVGELAGCYGHLRALALEHGYKETLQEQLRHQIDECFSEIRDLNTKLDDGDKDPNWKQLSNWTRFFLWYKPLGWREYVPHLLTYVCFAVAVWLGVRIAVNWADDGPSHLMFAFMLLAFTFVFHYWSLDERRRELGYRKKPGKISGKLLVQAPENLRMLVGQFLFFLGITVSFILLITAANYLFDYLKVRVQGTGRSDMMFNVFLSLFLFVFVSLYTSIFHSWATAEYQWSSSTTKLSSLRFRVFWHAFRNLRRYYWRLIKCLMADIFGLFFIGFGCFGTGVMLMDPRQRDWTGTAIASVVLLLGVFSIYGANRVMKIYYSIDLAQTAEPLKGTAAAAG